MSWLPPFSRGGAVRAASAGDPVELGPGTEPRTANSGSGGSASGGTRFGSVSISACSRAFHLASSSADGAVPISPGWTMPANDTAGDVTRCRIWPGKSQIAL